MRLTRLLTVGALAGTVALSGNAAEPKFFPDDPILVDDDKAFDASNAQEIEPSKYYDFIENTFLTPGEERDIRAMNINTVDEVPNSTWFTNRIGQRAMSIAEIAKGPNRFDALTIDGWPIVEGKGVGQTPGFRVADPGGHLYQIELDLITLPEAASGAEIIGTAFSHAFGYNVVEAYLVEVDPDQLEILPGATIEIEGERRQLTRLDLEEELGQAARLRNGKYRALASRFADGRQLGHFSYDGTRSDDPNDVFPHEHRRELRGNRVFAAWLNHVDSRGINSLDMLEGPEGHKYIKHYMFDFGSIMGGGGPGFTREPRAGNEYILDWKRGFATMATFGLYVRPWLKVDYPDLSPAVGRFEAESFDPEIWRPEYPNPAFRNLQRDDAYWAARIVGTFSDQAIRAVAAAAEYTDPRVTDYITATLIQRRDKVVRHWLNQINPVEHFQLDPSGVFTFENTAVKLGVATPARNYVLTWYRFDNATGEYDLMVEEEWIEEPRAQVPNAVLAGQDFVAVVIRGIHPEHPTWLRSARVHFRKTADGWETVGVERGYDYRVPRTRPQ